MARLPMAGLPIDSTTNEQQQSVANIAGSLATPSVTPTTAPAALPQTNSYGNDMGLANQFNAQAAKMKELNATPALPTPGGSNSMPEAPKYNPFDRPGDGNGDAAARASQYDNLMSQAASQTGFGARKRSAAMLGAAQGMMAPGLASMKQQGDDYAQKMNAFNVGSLPVNIGGSGGFNADTMKDLMSMFQTNQKPGDPAAPGATTPATAPATTPAVTSPAATYIGKPVTDVTRSINPIYGSFGADGYSFRP